MEEKQAPASRFIKADAAIRKVFKTISQIATVGLLFVALLATSDTIASKIFGTSIPLANELISYVLVVIVASVIGYIQIDKGHIRITILLDRYPGVMRVIMDILINLVSMAITGFTAYCTFRYMSSAIASGSKIATVYNSPRVWPFGLALALGFALLALAFVWCMIKSVYEYNRKKEGKQDG